MNRPEYRRYRPRRARAIAFVILCVVLVGLVVALLWAVNSYLILFTSS